MPRTATSVNVNHGDTGVSEEVSRRDAEIAEESKPKLRHGDYGMVRGFQKLMIRSGGKIESCGSSFMHGEGSMLDDPDAVILGNIFDDLKAMREDVDEFEIEGRKNHVRSVKVDKGLNHINIFDPDEDGLSQIAFEDLPDFILKLRQMEATLKRKEGGKK